MAATKKPKPRSTRDQVAQAAQQVEAYLNAHPGENPTTAVRALSIGIPVKTIRQFQRRVHGAGSTDFPLDAIPERGSKTKGNGAAGTSPYAISKRRRATEIETALDLLRMALRILERQLAAD